MEAYNNCEVWREVGWLDHETYLWHSWVWCVEEHQDGMGWDTFLHYIQFDVGLGDQIRFWHDQLCGEQSLDVVYNVLNDNSPNQVASVESLLGRLTTGVMKSWDVRYVWSFNDFFDR